MTVCLHCQGYGFLAVRRGSDRMTWSIDLPQRRSSGGVSKPASRNSQPRPTSRYLGGIWDLANWPESAGNKFVYAFVGALFGKVCRQRLPGLMVAIKKYDNEAGRIIPSTHMEY